MCMRCWAGGCHQSCCDIRCLLPKGLSAGGSSGDSVSPMPSLLFPEDELEAVIQSQAGSLCFPRSVNCRGPLSTQVSSCHSSVSVTRPLLKSQQVPRVRLPCPNGRSVCTVLVSSGHDTGLVEDCGESEAGGSGIQV